MEKHDPEQEKAIRSLTDKEMIHMVSRGAVLKPDGTKVTLDDLEKAGIKMVEDR